VYLTDERSGEILCRLYPQDKQANARGVRRALEPLAGAGADRNTAAAPAASGAMAPLLAKLIAQQSATGLPPPYLPKDEPPEES
jgi:hypothetical protein